MNNYTAVLYQLIRRIVDFFDGALGWLRSVPPRTLFIAVGSLGSLVLAVNSLVQTMTVKINSDTVAQQLIVNQWLNGAGPADAVVGETNYLLKFPFYALMELLPIDPAVRLSLSAVILAVAAWALIVFVVYKLARLLDVDKYQMSLLALLMLFLAVVSDHTMWLHYPNSRTIEVGLMMAVIYGLIRLYQHRWNYGRLALLSVGMGLIFINDKYALYTIGAASGIYFGSKMVAALLDKNRRDFADELRPVVALIGGAVVYFVGTFLINNLSPVTIHQVGYDQLSSVQEAWNMIPVTVHALLTIFNANFFGQPLLEPVTAVRALNFIILTMVIAAIVIGHRRLDGATRILLWIPAGVIAMFIISGRSMDASTDRYLILVPFVAVAAVAFLFNKRQHKLSLLLPAALMLSFVLWVPSQGYRLSALTESRNFQQINSIHYEVISAAKSEGVTKGYDTFFAAMSVSYLSDGEVLSVPYKCHEEEGYLLRTKLLTEAASFDRPADRTFVRVDNPTETNECMPGELQSQLGQPYKEVQLSDGSKLLFYERDVLSESPIII